jgi:hypothetical protein
MVLMTADDYNECGVHELRYFLSKQQVGQGDRRKVTMIPIAVSLGFDRAAWGSFWENAHDYSPWPQEKRRTTLPSKLNSNRDTEIEDQKGDESEDRSDWETVNQENTETAIQDYETAFRGDSKMANQDNENAYLTINQDNGTLYQGDETMFQSNETMFQGDKTLFHDEDGTMFQGDALAWQGDTTMFLDNETVFPGDATMFTGEETMFLGDETMLPATETALQGDETMLLGGETTFPDYTAPDYHFYNAMSHPSPILHPPVSAPTDLPTIGNDTPTVLSLQPHQPQQALPRQSQVHQATQPQPPQPSTPSIPDSLKMRILVKHTEWKTAFLDYDNPDAAEALENELCYLEREARGIDKDEYKVFKWEAGGYGTDWPNHVDPE